MHQIWIPKAGAPSVLEIREAADPTPGPGEVRICVHYSGINFADLSARRGLYRDAPPFPAVVGYEVSGKIDALGEGVDESRMGEAVLALTRFGGYSSHVIVREAQAITIPQNITLKTAAALPVTGLTSYLMLEIQGRVREGDRVLVHSAGGGVGLMALDILNHRKATAVGTASARKHSLLLERGYAQLVDYTKEDFYEVLKDGPLFDLIIDPVGGDSWSKGMDLLKPGGRLIMFGASSAGGASAKKGGVLDFVNFARKIPWKKMLPISLINQNKGIIGANLGRLWDHEELAVTWLHEVVRLAEAKVLDPLIHEVVPFREVARAHQLIHDRQNIGKVLLSFKEDGKED